LTTIAAIYEIEGSLWSTIKNIILRPGIAIREYIEGRRKTMYNAGKFLLVIGAISTLVVLRFNSVTEITDQHFPL